MQLSPPDINDDIIISKAEEPADQIISDLNEVKISSEPDFEGKRNAEEAKVGEWLKITEDGGILKRIIRAGQGENLGKSGDKATVHYVGRLKSNGEEFDSSRRTSYPYKFDIGAGDVISGWEHAVQTMVVGETAE